MRKLLPFLILLVAVYAKATTTLTISVVSMTGGTSPGNSVRIDLQNCAGARVVGTGQIVGQSQTVYPIGGVVTVTLYDNVQIDCGGGRSVSYYSFNYIFQGVITSIGSYNLLPGTFLLANLTPCVGTACISPTSGGGGGGSPGAPQFSFQYFKNLTTFGGAGSSTDSTGMQMNTPILNGAYDAFKFQSAPGSNNGIANAEAAAAGGTTIANPNYPFTEQSNPTNFPTSTGTFIDRRGGGETNWATDPLSLAGQIDVSAYGYNCMFTILRNPNGMGADFCRNNSTVIQGIGNDTGGGVVRVGGDVSLITQTAAGITAEDERTINCWHSGDCHANRDTFSVGGTNEDLSREGHGDFMAHYIQYPAVWVSTIASITDQQHIKMNPGGTAGAYGVQYGGGWLVRQDNLDSTNITADSAASGGIRNRRFTTSSTHAVSTAWGTTITVMNSPADFVNGDSTVIQVTKLGGTWPASGNVCISGDHTYETTFTAASGTSTVTLTLMVRYEEPVGSLIVVGSCMKGFSVPDRQLNFSNSQITSEISPDIIGAPDANTYFYTITGFATDNQSALNSDYNWRTDTTMNLIAGSSVTRDGSNNISFPSDSGNNGLGYKFMGTRAITVSGCATSNFNFGPSTITIPPNGNPFALQFVQPGAVLGAGTSTGCVISMTGLNGLTVHKAAKVISVTNPATPKNQLALNGYAQLGTHTMGLVVGDAVEQPGTNSILIDGITEVKGQTPTLGGQPSHIIDWDFGAQGGTSGAQISGGFTPININNANPFSMYTGGGGLYTLPQLASIGGPWSRYWSIANAPANGGQLFLMGCPPEGCNSPTPYNLFQLGGTLGGKLSYTPLSGVMGYNGTFFSHLADSDDSQSFTYRTKSGLLIGFQIGSPQFSCISFINNCNSSVPNDASIIADSSGGDKNTFITFRTGGSVTFRTLVSGFTFATPCAIRATLFDCSNLNGNADGAEGDFNSLKVSGTSALAAVTGTQITGSTGIGPSSAALWTTGVVDPSGACNTGSLYSNTAGAATHVFWVCVAGAWVNDK